MFDNQRTEFNPRWFVSEGHENDPGEWQEEDRALFRAVRASLPELEGWGDLPIGVAWGAYSQDTWMVSWLEESQHVMDRKGLIPFLAYIHYHEINHAVPRWGIPVEELEAHAAEYSLS